MISQKEINAIASFQVGRGIFVTSLLTGIATFPVIEGVKTFAKVDLLNSTPVVYGINVLALVSALSAGTVMYNRHTLKSYGWTMPSILDSLAPLPIPREKHPRRGNLIV